MAPGVLLLLAHRLQRSKAAQGTGGVPAAILAARGPGHNSQQLVSYEYELCIHECEIPHRESTDLFHLPT